MFADLRTWPTRRWMIAAGVAGAAFVALVVASGLVTFTGGSITAPWWGYAVAASGAGLVGLIVASYIGTPIGADATLCDTRWPVLSMIALYLATDLRSVEPVLTGIVRPVVALAAIALLVWALRERLVSEHRASARRDANTATGSVDGDVCTTCRPLFSRTSSSGHDSTRPGWPRLDKARLTTTRQGPAVRTSEEYNAGHLDGALNIDGQSPDFDSLITALPADGDYVVYCASGNRSAAAVARMTDLGFSTLTDAGSFSDASASTGLATVTAP